MTSISIQIADTEMGDDEDSFVKVPAHWVICSTCRGNGQHSLGMGCFTQDDMDEQGPDFREDYMSGRYDQSCEPCSGTGKVLVINRDAPMNAQQKAALAKQDSDDEIDRELDAEHRAEIAFGC